MPDVSFTDPLVKLTLMSGAEWTVTLSDVLLALASLLLLAEVIKGARPGAKYLTDHLLSLIVFGAAAAEFVLWPKFGTSTYFLLTALSLVDFLSGLALRTRRRAVAVAAAPAPPPKAAAKVEAPAPVPAPEPEPAPPAGAPAPAAPAAASVAEAVLQDHPEPKPVQPIAPETAPVVPEAALPKTPSPEASSPEASSPEVPSPGIQPGSGPQPSPDKPDTPPR
jgi:hypothetical protein